jgi:hypothetical protein
MLTTQSYKVKAWSILTLWSFFLLYDLVFRHYHYDNNGNLISHVHVYDKTNGDHQHTDDDFHWLDQISNYNVLLEQPLVIQDYHSIEVKHTSTKPFYVSRLSNSFHNSFFLRGPPSLV